MIRRLAIPLAMLLALALATPAGAVIYGQPDDGRHPHVGQLLFYVPDDIDPRFDDPGSWFNCSGTLLDSTHLLTAGHCVFGVGLDGEETTSTGGAGGNDVWLNFGEAPDYSILPPSAGFIPDGNQDRYDAWEAALEADPNWIRGTAHPHPDYNDRAFFLFDLGVVVLDEPVETGGVYGQLPTLGQLDALAHPKGRSRFTAVGYGLEWIRPVGVVGTDTRQTAQQMLVDHIGVFGLGPGIAAIFSSNNGRAHQGGTCYGDSGGPIFVGDGDVIVAVTSFGLTPWCTGNGGGYRVDQPDDLNWLAGAFGLTP